MFSGLRRIFWYPHKLVLYCLKKSLIFKIVNHSMSFDWFEELQQNQISCKPLIYQTLIIWFNIIQSLKYLRSTTFGSKARHSD